MCKICWNNISSIRNDWEISGKKILHEVLDSDADEEKEGNVLIDRALKMNFKLWKIP